MLAEICLTILLVSLIVKMSERPKNFPPGPRGAPLVGYLPFFSSWDPQYPHRAMKKMADVFGPVTGFYMGPNLPFISVCGPEAVKEALHNDDLNGRPYSAITAARTFGETLGIMFVKGHFWQEQRRFTMRHLRDLGFGKTTIEDQMSEELTDLIKDVENCSQSTPNQVVDLKSTFQVSVQNILWALVAGERFQRNDPKFEQLLTANEKLFRAGDPVRGNIPVPYFLLKKSRMIQKFIGLRFECISPIREFVQETIDEHVRNRSKDDARDFIDVYLNEMEKQNGVDPKSTFTNNQLVAVILDLFGAGAESTSNSIGFAIIHLIRNQEVQKKMQAELDDVCGECVPGLGHRTSLPYTEAVLMEAQRCSSIAPFAVPHYATKETQLQGYNIPQGSIVMLNLDAVLNDPTHWKDPDVFRPERHLNEDGTKVIKNEHFYPFGTGKRMCLGESLAKNTYFLFTAGLIKKFKFEPVPNEPLPTLEPVNGFTLGYQGFKAVVTQRS